MRRKKTQRSSGRRNIRSWASCDLARDPRPSLATENARRLGQRDCFILRQPMKDFYICDCVRHENKIVTSTFVVVAKQIKPKKTGEPYLALTLGDRSGQLEAKMWDNVEEVLEAFEQDDFLKIKGLINKYKQRFQLTIHKLRKLGDSEIEFADYLPKTTKDIDELWQTLAGFISTFRNPHLKSLVQAFMADPEIASAYRNAPAAKT